MVILNVGHDFLNSYLVGPLLVDCSMPGTLGRFMAHLRRMDVPFERIRYLLATHYHPDHAGIAGDLKQKGVQLVMLDVQHGAVPWLNGYFERHGGGVAIGMNDNVEVTLEGSRAFLARLGIAGQIVHTPGHSDDSVTLVLDDGGALVGDLTPEGAATEESAEAVAASWRRLRDLGVNRVYPGHGPDRPL